MSILTSVIQRGTRAAQPSASITSNGALYYVTDERVLEQVISSAWVAFSEPQPFYNAGNTSTALTIDWTNGLKQRCTATGSMTFTFSNPVDGARHVLHVGTGAGSFVATFPTSSTLLWPGGVAPVLTVTASKVDMFVFFYQASTSRYYGMFTQNF